MKRSTFHPLQSKDICLILIQRSHSFCCYFCEIWTLNCILFQDLKVLSGFFSEEFCLLESLFDQVIMNSKKLLVSIWLIWLCSREGFLDMDLWWKIFSVLWRDLGQLPLFYSKRENPHVAIKKRQIIPKILEKFLFYATKNKQSKFRIRFTSGLKPPFVRLIYWSFCWYCSCLCYYFNLFSFYMLLFADYFKFSVDDVSSFSVLKWEDEVIFRHN